MAFDARDHLGVNVHTLNSAYSDTAQLENFLAYLGVKWVRDDNPNGPSLLSGYNVQYVNTATNQTTAVTNTNTALTAGAKAIELLNEPPTVPLVFGASIGGSETTIAAQDARFGKVPIIRSFSSGMPSAVPAGMDSSRIWHHSFKGVSTNFTAMAAGTWDAQLLSWLRGLPAWLNLWITYYHEPEGDWPSGASYSAAQTHFINLVKNNLSSIPCNVKVVPVFTAYILSHGHTGVTGGTSAYNINDFWPTVTPDMVGFDFDGVTNTTSYFDWAGIGYMSWAETFAVSKGIPYVVPEFAGNAISSDTSHAGRTAYINAQAAAFTASPSCVAVEFWDTSSSNLTTTNEITAWKILCQQSASMIQAQQTNLAIIAAVKGKVPVIASGLTDGILTRNAFVWGLYQGQQGITEGNLHLYRGNASDTDWTTHRTAGYALLPVTASGITYQVTATGYHDYTGASDNTPDATAATEIVPDFQQLIADGATKVFFYEAVDEDLAYPTSSAGYFGLAQDDWTPKAQAASLQSYIAGFVTGPTAPLAPLTVVAMPGDSIASVVWTVSPVGTPADNYTVTCSDPSIPTQTVIAPTQAAVFAGLTDGTSYTFTVVANNTQGSSAGVVSNSVTPVLASGGGTGVPAVGGGGTVGSIAPVVRTPFPASYPTPLASVSPNVGKNGQPLVGQTQQLFFYDPATADLLQIVPNQTGIWLTDIDLGYPVIREVTQSNPGRNGEYDQTRFFGARAITLSLTVMQALDMSGTMQPASYWLEVLRAWMADPSNRFRLGFQMQGQQQRFATVRASDASGPFIGSGVGRTSVSVQITLKSPDGLLYEQNPLPNDLAVLQNGILVGDGRFESIIPQAVAGSGISPPLTPPVVIPVSSSGIINVPYKGSARSAPEIRIIGACTDPAITALNPDGTARGQLSFTGLTLAGTDELRLDLSAKTAIRIASGAIASNVRQNLTSWSWFDLLPDATGTLNRLKFTVGSGTATAKCYYLNAYV